MALIRDLVLQVVVWLAAGAATTVPTDGLAQAVPDPEYQLKAVFLFNFAQFVEWPAARFPSRTRRWSSASWARSVRALPR